MVSEASLAFCLVSEAVSLVWDSSWEVSMCTRDESDSEREGGSGDRLPLEGMSVFGILVGMVSVMLQRKIDEWGRGMCDGAKMRI